MAVPTFVSETQTAWNSDTSPKTTASISVNNGDFLVAAAVNADNAGDLGVSGGGLTWTLRGSVQANTYDEVRIWTSTATSTTSITVSFTSTQQMFGGSVTVWRDSDGLGAVISANQPNHTPNRDITTTQADSAIVIAIGDWNAGDGSTRTWDETEAGTLTEVNYFRDSGQYTTYMGYYADSGAIATKAVGLSSPGSQKYSLVALEVLGSTGPAGAFLPFINKHRQFHHLRR